ncbi:MAG: isoprenylcysteine carboxylmethyltransferase family protein [Geobacteraceae bacterium]|nr:isoprenylcysteine carboxylmethyltransferase family protein [Geobacteraceae bacterium]NTW79153.1 isoprenylcysteine carboxylmethyltransferase family protein [Geobacteraceae bacterium]
MPDVILFLFRFLLFALVHSVLAIPSLKKRCIGQNRHLRRFYRLYYNLVSIVLFSWVMATLRNSAVLYVVPGIWSLVLYSMQMVFIIILVACARQTGVAEFLGVTGEASDELKIPKLITDGWYRVVRHPLYLFSMLFLLSNPVISVRWLLLTLLSAVYFVAGALLEERRLLQEFGDEYRAYQLTVPFMIPRIFIR